MRQIDEAACGSRKSTIVQLKKRVQSLLDLRQAGSPEELEKFSILICNLNNRIYMLSTKFNLYFLKFDAKLGNIMSSL
jgi:hypothetical protein